MANNSKGHRFGGDWTSRKLEMLAAYLAEYRKALKNQPVRVIALPRPLTLWFSHRAAAFDVGRHAIGWIADALVM